MLALMKLARRILDWIGLQRAGWRAVNYGDEI